MVRVLCGWKWKGNWRGNSDFLCSKDVVPEWSPSEAVDMDLNNQAMVTDSKSLSTEMPLVTSLREAAKMGGKGTNDDESLRTEAMSPLQTPASTVIFWFSHYSFFPFSYCSFMLGIAFIVIEITTRPTALEFAWKFCAGKGQESNLVPRATRL